MNQENMTVAEYRPAWRQAIRDIHVATAGERTKTDEKHREMSLLLYCEEYLDHEIAYVLLDEEQIPRGYILCAPDAKIWLRNMKPYVEKINALGSPYDLIAAYSLREYDRAYEEYPAHLHIDILEEYTGNHHGTMLMNTLLNRLKADGVKGICLGVAKKNERAFGFYRHMGFEVLEEDKNGYSLGMKL